MLTSRDSKHSRRPPGRLVFGLGRLGYLLPFLAASALAHHGVAPHYDDSQRVNLDGVVTEFEFINPHSFVRLRVVDQHGVAAVWSCEMASRSVLARNGLDIGRFAPGTKVRIEGSQARHNPMGCALREARFEDGSVLRSSEFFAATPATAAVPTRRKPSIEGVWAMKTFAVSFYTDVLTAEGERLRAAFDPIKDDPAIYCDPASPVRFWVNVNEPFALHRESNTVVIDHQFMDSQRIIHLDQTAPPAGTPRSTMGYSTGRYEGDALVISTTNFVQGVLEPRRGVMHTDSLRLTERLAVTDAGELAITWTIDDPVVFKEPHTQTELYVRTQAGREPYDCKPGYQQ